jgi:hypothetical protein
LRSSGADRARRALAHCAAAIASAAGVACAGAGAPPQSDAPPAPLVASDEMPGDFLLRQQIRYRWPGGQGVLDAAVQSACGELHIVLLTPFGTAGTEIQQVGWDVVVRARHAGPLPFAPERILLDVQRTYLPAPADPPRDGARERRVHGQRIEERWEDGRLVERVFHPMREGDDRVRIRYREGAGADAPSATLESERFHYALDVTTLSRVAVACGIPQ